MNKINLKGKIIGGFCALSGVFILTLPIPIVVNSFAPFYKNRLWRNEVIIIIIINLIIITIVNIIIFIIIILRSPLFAPFYKNGLWRNEVPALKLSTTKKRRMIWSSGGAEEERAHQEDGCGQTDGPEVFPHPGRASEVQSFEIPCFLGNGHISNSSGWHCYGQKQTAKASKYPVLVECTIYLPQQPVGSV